MEYTPGQEIVVNDQPLRVNSRIGRGSIHNVYNCTRLDSFEGKNPDLVLKQFALPRRDNCLIRQFAREALTHFDRTRTQLIAAGIPNVYFCDSSHIVMDYVPGENLDRLHPSPDITDRVAYIRDLFFALIEPMEALRTAGLVHRDIKPANIMVRANIQPSERGSATLIDLDSITPILEKSPEKGGIIFGTPAHMSPEVGAFGFYQFGSDVYALGISAMFILEDLLNTRIRGIYTSHCSTATQYNADRQYDRWLNRGKWKSLPDYLRQSGYAPDTGSIQQMTKFIYECLHLLPSDRPKNGEEMRQILTDTGNVSEV